MSNPYPDAEQVPWKPYDNAGQPAYWVGINKPIAVVLHIMQGYASTARQWANEGHYGASWHYTVARDGSIMQHLRHEDAGYHAGIPVSAPSPVWALWHGHGQNVNHYTIGIEHEGFAGTPWPPVQAAASRELCRWLARELGIPLDYDHFPPHAAIDVVNRVNDFNVPALRDAHYGYLFEEETEMALSEEDVRRIATEAAEAFIGANFRAYLGLAVNGGEGAFSDAQGAPLPLVRDEALVAAVAALQAASGAAGAIPEHTHEPGGVQR